MADERSTREMLKAKYKDLLGMAWILGGKELILLRGGENEYRLERHSWPEDRLLAKSDAADYEADVEVVAAAVGPYAAIMTWWDGGSGFEIIDLNTLSPIPSTRYSSSTSAKTLARLAFSPDDRFLVAIFRITPKEGDSPGQAVVGFAVIGTVGEWDYLEIPLRVDMPEDADIHTLDEPGPSDFHIISFTEPALLALDTPGGERMTLDIEKLRRDPHWLAVRDRRRQTEREGLEEEVALVRNIRVYNQRAFEMSLRLVSEGLTCPWCKRHGQDIRYHPGRGERALFICPGCGRSFGPDSPK